MSTVCWEMMEGPTLTFSCFGVIGLLTTLLVCADSLGIDAGDDNLYLVSGHIADSVLSFQSTGQHSLHLCGILWLLWEFLFFRLSAPFQGRLSRPLSTITSVSKKELILKQQYLQELVLPLIFSVSFYPSSCFYSHRPSLRLYFERCRKMFFCSFVCTSSFWHLNFI